jgi:DNA processing protein
VTRGDRDESRAFLALLLMTPRHWAAVAERVEELGSAVESLRQGTGQMDLWGSDPGTSERLEEAGRLLEQWGHEGMGFASVIDDDYPEQLLTIHQRPPFVMWRGTRMADDARGVAVVGTRKPSAKGVDRARRLARDLAERGVTVISGLAAGIDTAVHLGALEGGGRTVSVIGTGLRRNYPRENADLQARIAEHGLVLSQFLPDAPPSQQSFPMRNAVMSGYAAATVVIEAAWKSGARMQARLALEHGRTVFLLSSLLEHDWAREYAERPGAHVVETVDDVLEHLDTALPAEGELTWA